MKTRIILVALLASTFHASSEEATPKATLTVTTDTVRTETVSKSISGTGLVEAWRDVAVGAEIGGLVLEEMLVDEGDEVEAGQVLARLDRSILEVKAQEQAAMVASAEATLSDATAAAERSRSLSGSGAITKETILQRETSVKTAEAGLAQSRAAERNVLVQLEKTIVKAPFAGIVSSQPAVAGSIVSAGAELLRLQRDGRLRAVVSVPEQQLATIAVGDAAILTSGSMPVEGKVSKIGVNVNSTTHLGSVFIDLPAESGFRSGMFVQASIASGSASATTVAESSLVWRDGKPRVFVVDENGMVSMRTVVAGNRSVGRVAVTGELSVGEKVATQGAGFLGDGNRVRVVTTTAENTK